jgi:endonuclease G
VRRSSDVLTFRWNGATRRELLYQHFSVVMCRSRRLCFFSAVNIDGKNPRRFKRPPWRLDPRIPATRQIREECYGNEPMFSRGHMTRREDPIWGDPEEAALGNSDSMHVTNTVPQMQPFNAGIWLNLESYALEHARDDDMRISVFTGPFLFEDDPVRYGVQIPRSFWKVIAFIHDRTGRLCATGYTMSQEDFLRDEEFVFGQHNTWQTRIGDIERRANVSFGRLAALDPFEGSEERVARPLTDPSQIEFG